MPTSRARSIFAARLKAARLAAGLTQRALGVRIGLPEEIASTRINRYERAVHDCDLETADRLACALDVPLAGLYADSDRVAGAIKILSKLPITDLEALVAHLKKDLPSL